MFLFLQRRMETSVDSAFQRGPLVIQPVHGARELDEFVVKALLGLVATQGVLDIPQMAIDRRKVSAFGDVLRQASIDPTGKQRRPFPDDVFSSGTGRNPARFQLQDRQAVEHVGNGGGS